MNFYAPSFRFIHVMSALALAWSAGGAAAGSGDLPQVFTFAAGYRVDSPSPSNFVEYGVIRKCGDAWCMDVERYDSAKLLPRVPTKYVHEMNAPYGGTTCLNGPVSRVRKDVVEQERPKIRRELDGILVETRNFRYRWATDASAPSGYKLVEIARSVDRAQLEQVVGFAFAADRPVGGDVTPAQVAWKYKGEIYAKTAFTGVSGQWSFKSSIIDFRRFQVTENGAVLALTEPGQPAIVKKYGGPMWVHNSIIMARSPSPIAPIVEEYGHDFNRDGCFNESGHNKMMLPVAGDASGVLAFVYIEYTADIERGFPMMSVGRYYR